MFQSTLKRQAAIFNRKRLVLLFLSCVLGLLETSGANAAANFVYHEQSNNFVATPVCPEGGTNMAPGRYVENIDRDTAAGFQVFQTESYTLRYRINFAFATNQIRVYYTTDGTNPAGSFGNGSGTTQVITTVYTTFFRTKRKAARKLMS
ncbi:MAG: hypothetical protein M3209_05945 [Acidobacteriota bacterium]|nr:hypothetical protein [Acidobacteriota bacterium]